MILVGQEDLFDGSESIDFLEEIFSRSEQLYLKKLSRNDRDWARLENKKQSGVYISPVDRDGGFFPALNLKKRSPGEPPILEAFFETVWPEVNERKTSRLVNYTSKGPETHFTRLPKAAFKSLNPASFLLIGREANSFTCITVDSQQPGYEIIIDRLSLPPDFAAGIFNLEAVERRSRSELASFVEAILGALAAGRIEEPSKKYAKLPPSTEVAALARNRYLRDNNLDSLSPFLLDNPGDAIRTISRGIEYEIIKERQLRAKAVELVRVIVGDEPNSGIDQVVRNIAYRYADIDAILLSASQQRRSRAGLSFEHHISAMLTDGGIPFEEQVILESKKRPDFILPSLALYNQHGRTYSEALVLSAKTTLRERWKQVPMEINNCELFLATVDETISENAIQEMGARGIFLVVPESLKDSDTTEYKDSASVISFKEFFLNNIRATRWPLWSARGLVKQC